MSSNLDISTHSKVENLPDVEDEDPYLEVKIGEISFCSRTTGLSGTTVDSRMLWDVAVGDSSPIVWRDRWGLRKVQIVK